MKISDLKVGDVLYDTHSERAGHTELRREGVWKCYVRAVDPAGQWVDISWNGNPARRWRSVPTRFKWSPKEWVKSDCFGGPRRCYVCKATEPKGHATDCAHPKAVAARKKAAKVKP